MGSGKKLPRLSPSILSADFSRLGDQIARLERAGAHEVHVDVMDGRFVPNLTIGPVVVEAIRRSTSLPLDVHLMIEDPGAFVEAFRRAGSTVLTIHLEAFERPSDAAEVLRRIRDVGMAAGLSIRPGTPPEAIAPFAERLDRVLLMTVEPGFGGQGFLPGSLDRIRALSEWINGLGGGIDLAVDGGINLENAAEVVRAGANVAVAGSAVFGRSGEADIEGNVRALLRAMGACDP